MFRFCQKMSDLIPSEVAVSEACRSNFALHFGQASESRES